MALVRPFWRTLGLAWAQLLLITAFDLLKPWPLKLVVDTVVGDQPAPAPLRMLLPAADLTPRPLLLIATLGVLLVAAGSGALTVWHNHTAIGLGQNIVGTLRERLHAHLLRQSLAFHGASTAGDLTYRVTADSFAVQTWIMNGFLPILSSGVLIVAMSLILISLDGRLAALSLAVGPALFVLIARLSRRIDGVAAELRDRQSALWGHVQANFAAIRTVQAFGREAIEHRRFAQRSRNALQTNLRLYDWQTLYGALVNLVAAGGTACILYVGGERVLAGRISLGDLVIFVAYLATLYGPVNQIAQSLGLIAAARIGVTRCTEILADSDYPPDGARRLTRERARGSITWRGVHFAYRPGTAVLRGASFTVSSGQRVAVVGATGAGKSTLLSLLPRFWDPDRGAVLIDGTDVREFTLASLRRQIAMVLQPPLILPLTLAENIAYGRPRASLDQIRDAASLAQLDDVVARLPQGFETVIGEGGTELSEGERQRVTIARALLRDAPILLLDEPTSALDGHTEASVVKAIASLSSGRTTIIIAHRLSTVLDADLILVLEDGRVVESGNFASLLKQGGRFARLHDLSRRTPPMLVDDLADA